MQAFAQLILDLKKEKLNMRAGLPLYYEVSGFWVVYRLQVEYVLSANLPRSGLALKITLLI